MEVGGVWDLRGPLGDVRWGLLVRYIRERGWLLCMIVEDREGPGGTLSEKGEEDRGEKNGDADGDGSIP